jgi:diadenylate cyclase
MAYDFLKDIAVIDVIDIMAVSILLYILFLWFKRTKSSFVFVGIVISSIAYMTVKLLRLRLVATLMQGFFAVILVAIVIIFQEEIRRLFEQIARWAISPKFRNRKMSYDFHQQINMLVNTTFAFAHEKVGAILVLTGKDIVMRHIHGGVELDGTLSESLLKSIFDPHSDGHDGSVLIEKGKVLKFACHLPLSRDSEQLKEKGTRHAAALGLSELTDALCIVVSETTGDVSVARHGKINKIDEKEKLGKLLESFQQETMPVRQSRGVKTLFVRNYKVKITAVSLSVFLWFVLVHESVIVYKTYYVPVQYAGLDNDLEVREIGPARVKIVLSAARRDFYFVDKEDIRIVSKLFDLGDLRKSDGKYYETTITASDITLPAGYTVVNIFPRDIKFCIERKPFSPER